MAPATRRAAAPSRGGCLRAAVLALAALASPARLGASAERSSGAPDWHVVRVGSLLPSAACTAAGARGRVRLVRFGCAFGVEC